MKRSLIIIALLAIFAGCEESGAPVLPGKVGPAGELLVVANENIWKSKVGDAIRSVVDQPYPVLPQAESYYDIQVLDPQQFDKFWKPHRNILYVDIADRVDTQEPSVKFYKDRYATGQVFIEAKGRTLAEVAQKIIERGEEMLSVLNNEEISRIADRVRAFDNEALKADLEEKYRISLDVPRDGVVVSEKVRNGEQLEFLWIQREMTRMKGAQNHDVKEGFFIYTFPYESDSVFSMPWLIAKHNSMLEKYVPGPSEGSFMTTSLHLTPRYEEVLFDGKFASEIRGLWRMENDFMGGPFYLIAFFDEPNNRIIVASGYAYAPYFDKREYIREVEAVIKTLRVLPPEA